VTGNSSQGVTQSHPLTSNNWNLVGISEDISVEDFISASTASGASIIIKDFDGFYIPGDNSSTIDTLEAGEAYFVKK